MATKTEKKSGKDKGKEKGKDKGAGKLIPYVTEVSVSYGATINMGDYESLRLDARATVRVDGKPPRHEEEAALVKEALFKHAWATVQGEITEQAKKANEKRKSRRTAEDD